MALDREKLAKVLEDLQAPEPLVINARRGAYDDPDEMSNDFVKFKLNALVERRRAGDFDKP